MRRKPDGCFGGTENFFSALSKGGAAVGSCVWGMAMLSMSSGEQASLGHLPSLQGGLQYKPCNEPLWHRSGRALSWWLSSVFQGLWVAKKLEVKVAQSCLTLRDPIGFTVREILQVRILEWVAFSFSRGSSQPRDQTHVSFIAGGFFTS